MDNFLSNGGKIPTSIPEQQLIDAIRNLGYLCVDGLTVGKYFPDGVLFYKDLKIDVEYDGIYWHSNKSNKDDIRDLYFLENGYKIFRIKANKGIPDDQQISEALNQLIYNDRYYYELYI
jgi:very-short-patch-repair endonuclease